MICLSHVRSFGPSPVSYTTRGTKLFSATTSRIIQPLPQIIRLRGKVDSGYGRGGKKLGFPTANLPSSLFQHALEQVPTGVYLGWAWIEGGNTNGRGVPHKAAVNVGFSPTFEGKENKEKIVEAHLILGAEEQSNMTDFYGEVMRVSLIGYLRPERKFDSFPELMEAITTDVAAAKDALDQAPYLSFRSDDTFLSNHLWIGKDGGDADASWECQGWSEA
jgi:riboflavin kinase